MRTAASRTCFTIIIQFEHLTNNVRAIRKYIMFSALLMKGVNEVRLYGMNINAVILKMFEAASLKHHHTVTGSKHFKCFSSVL